MSHEHIEITDQMSGQPKLAAEQNVGLAEVHAALAYYFDHRDAIDRQRWEIDAGVEDLRRRNPSPLSDKLQRPASG